MGDTFLDFQSIKMKIPNLWKPILDNSKTVLYDSKV